MAWGGSVEWTSAAPERSARWTALKDVNARLGSLEGARPMAITDGGGCTGSPVVGLRVTGAPMSLRIARAAASLRGDDLGWSRATWMAWAWVGTGWSNLITGRSIWRTGMSGLITLSDRPGCGDAAISAQEREVEERRKGAQRRSFRSQKEKL